MALITAVVGYVSVKKARMAEKKKRKELVAGTDATDKEMVKGGNDLGQAGGSLAEPIQDAGEDR